MGPDILDVVSDGDTIMKVSSGANHRLLRVSSQALKTSSSYFAALLSVRWTSPTQKAFTVSDPLIVQEHYDTAYFLLMMISHQLNFRKGETIAAIKLEHLRGLAILVDKYMFTGAIPASIKDSLAQYFSTSPQADYREISASPEILFISYFLNLPDLFAKASHQMMWFFSKASMGEHASSTLVPLLPVNIFQEFEKEGERLRSYLLGELPPVFYPDPHGGDSGDDEVDKWWCQKCAAFPHKERWLMEVVRQNGLWRWEEVNGVTFSLREIFSSYITDMQQLDYCGHRDSDGSELACGKFKVRYVDVNREEMIHDVYNAIGGVCIHCFRAGCFRYTACCPEHRLALA